MITSGKTVITKAPVRNDVGAMIDAGTEAMVIAIERDADPVVLLCETLENPHFEQEEFYCFADNLEVA